MKSFNKIKSIGTPLDKVDVDTDQIVPKQFLKLVQKTGFGKFLFYNWRFDNAGKPDPNFVLNDPKYANSKIMISRDNFGCGSSREHAAWALLDYGFSVIIAPSFADIFYSNCFKNGLLAIKIDSEIVDSLIKTESQIDVDLIQQTIQWNSKMIPFEIDEQKKKNLLEGVDEISLTLENEEKISDYEKKSTVPSIL